ncbi:hypothetical protein KRR38_32965 [Novosphingobium sp. G106]|uniref:hypothetical protein n=1 Tax=Novosphingobium sp. G106 TaxID=2849500 RepID=UPI001C2DC051|nr:hypothetical protein [Novosphingobium sp. G106]MBV1692335.1 hypothetical protein [Novosphingobium sp. G106]
MDIHNRVSKSIMDAGIHGSKDLEADAHVVAHAAIATTLNWLANPSEAMLKIGKDASCDTDARRCKRVWLAMLTQALKEAGFNVPLYGIPNQEDPDLRIFERPPAESLWARLLSTVRS